MDSEVVFSGGPLDGQTRTVEGLPALLEVTAPTDVPVYRDASELVARPVRRMYTRGARRPDGSWQYDMEVRS